jgi:hypothetical protein
MESTRMLGTERVVVGGTEGGRSLGRCKVGVDVGNWAGGDRENLFRYEVGERSTATTQGG